MKSIGNNECLKVIKEFRVANMNWGKAKRARNTIDMLRFNNILRKNIIRANELGFKIWINDNGCTGHTYDKDYRESNPKDNDFERYKKEVNKELRNTIEIRRFSPGDE